MFPKVHQHRRDTTQHKIMKCLLKGGYSKGAKEYNIQ